MLDGPRNGRRKTSGLFGRPLKASVHHRLVLSFALTVLGSITAAAVEPQATEYASATRASRGDRSQIVAALGSKLAGLATSDGRPLCQVDDIAGGLWTPSVLANGRMFCPLARETQVREPVGGATRLVWSSPVFEGVMGPVVELNGLLVGHHKRRLTALDAATGEQLWQLPDETDGQLLVFGKWLLFVNDRAGRLELLAVDRRGAEVRRRQAVIKPARMETPLTFARDTLYIRAPEELVALRLGD